jgi:hypothetical protein
MTTKRRPEVLLSDVLEDSVALAKGLSVEDRTGEFGRCLTFEANLDRPIHRWYRFKEGYSLELVHKLLAETAPRKGRPFSLLDPFCGSGTSLLAAPEALDRLGAKDVTLRGIEVNGYMHFVTTTKLNWQRYDPAFISRAAEVSLNGLRLRRAPQMPQLSTLREPRYIAAADLRRVLELRDKVRLVAKGRPELNPLLLGLASATERVVNLRKDGRALRYSARVDNASVDEHVAGIWSQIAGDLQQDLNRTQADWRVRRGDGRRSDQVLRGRRFDMILFSPPYLNNIDYTEVYKIEQWLLGFLSSKAEMFAQRQRTFRSHPSCIFPDFADAAPEVAERVLGPAFRRLLDYASAEEPWRRRLFAGYFADMLRTLQGCARSLKAGGTTFIVVGNSVHGTPKRPVPVATDLWIAKLAKTAGLRVDAILVGRRLPRKRMEWDGFRESIVVLSNPRR